MSILTQSAKFIRRTVGQLLEQDCLLCGATSGNAVLCTACVADLPRLTALHCPQCALPTPHGERCGHCLSQPPHFDATIASFSYDFPLDKLVQSFKYAHRLALGAWLGEQLAADARDCQADLIMPLPLHPLRLRDRGFNQALELARPISAAGGWLIDTQSCSRIRHTPAQAELPWRARVKNIRGAFHCSADLTGKSVALVDDVMTTGASLNECARTLKLHGAAHVTLLVVARALPKSA
jgi:ComF family protein